MSASTAARVDLVEQELVSSMARFIRMRWLAGLGVLAATAVVRHIFGLLLPERALYFVGAAILVYNAACYLVLRRLLSQEPRRVLRFRRLTEVQIGLDWLAMTALIHFSGGVESPALLYFFFHIILSAIFLTPAATYICAAAATVLVGVTAGLEYVRWLPHFTPFVRGPGRLHLFEQPYFVMGVMLFFATAMFVSAYLASTIIGRMRRREREIVDLGDNLRLAYDQLEGLDEMKSRFVLSVTHELRSPVGVIRSLLRTMTAGYAGELTAPQQDMIKRVLHRADYLQALIDDLLELAAAKNEIGIREEARVAVRLDEVARQVVERFETVARERGIALEFRRGDPAAPELVASPEGIDRIVNNLVSNAVKYTPDGGRVTVSLDREGESVRLEIADTGIGIPEDGLKRLFEEFYRAPNAKAQTKEGTGLGLVITRELVARYGGQIAVRSRLGAGTTVVVTFPLTSSG